MARTIPKPGERIASHDLFRGGAPSPESSRHAPPEDGSSEVEVPRSELPPVFPRGSPESGPPEVGVFRGGVPWSSRDPSEGGSPEIVWPEGEVPSASRHAPPEGGVSSTSRRGSPEGGSSSSSRRGVTACVAAAKAMRMAIGRSVGAAGTMPKNASKAIPTAGTKSASAYPLKGAETFESGTSFSFSALPKAMLAASPATKTSDGAATAMGSVTPEPKTFARNTAKAGTSANERATEKARRT